MTALAVFAAAGVLTYLARAVFILTVGSRPLPDLVEVGLGYVGPAVLAALTASLLAGDGVDAFLTSPDELAAVTVGLVLALRRSNVLVVLAGGMATLWLVGWLL